MCVCVCVCAYIYTIIINCTDLYKLLLKMYKKDF